jgi:hypothetical protein
MIVEITSVLAGGRMSVSFVPVVRADLPDGWFAKESITLLHPEGQANVIASSEPLDPKIDSFRYATVQGDLLRRDFQSFEEHYFRPQMIFGGRPGYLREFTWQPPDSVRVWQMQLYYAERGRGYTATATVPTSHYPELEKVLRDCMDQLQIGPQL